MRASVDRAQLAAVSGAVLSVAPQTAALPVLASVLLEARDGVLAVSATDLEVTVRAEVAAEVSEPGRLLLPAKLAMDAVRGLAGERLLLESRSKGGGAELSSAGARFVLAGRDPSQFPTMPIDVGRSQVLARIDGARLRRCLGRVTAVSSAFTKRIGELRLEPGRLRMFATDINRVAVAEEEAEVVSSGVRALLTARGLRAVASVRWDEGESPVEVSKVDDQLSFSSKGLAFYLRQADGEFPDCLAVIPRNMPEGSCALTASRAGLTSAIQRLALLASGRSVGVRMDWSSVDGVLTVALANPDLGYAIEQIAATAAPLIPGTQSSPTAPTGAIGLGIRYLSDAMAALEGADRIHLSWHSRVAVVRAEPATTDSRCLYVLAPLALPAAQHEQGQERAS